MTTTTPTGEVFQLKGISGDNPQGFLAALGIIVALEDSKIEYSISWDDGTNANPLVWLLSSTDVIAGAVLTTVRKWLDGPALLNDNSTTDELGLAINRDRLRELIVEARKSGVDGRILFSCVSEGALRKKGTGWLAKPTALYFTSGTEYFVKHARNILANSTEDDVRRSLEQPNSYRDLGGGRTMRWDVHDNAQYALSAFDPSSEKKLTNPGMETLAILGLSCIPCFTVNTMTRTQNVQTRTGRSEYKGASFRWPLWKDPLKLQTIKTLLTHVIPFNPSNYLSWGITKVFSSEINDISQGRKSFRYPSTIWTSGN